MFKLDAYKLKWIAMIGMVLNHTVIAWWDIMPMGLAFPFYLVGGFTFPIMGFFVVEGYKHTSNLKRYVGRILLVGLIALPFHVMTLGMAAADEFSPIMLFTGLNIMFTIALSIGVLVLYDKMNRVAFWFLFIIVITPISLVLVEWAAMGGIFMVLMYYIIKGEKARRIWPPLIAIGFIIVFSIIATIGKVISAVSQGIDLEDLTSNLPGLAGDPNFALVSSIFLVGILLVPLLLLCYNGERGKNMKWLFYIVYPLHLAILAIGRLFM